MDMLFPSWPLMVAFFAASVALAVTPGPAVVYIITRTLAQGRGAGLASTAGVALGNLGNATGAALGLAALFAVSSLAFTLVKYAGAAYLVWLGIRALRARDAAPAEARFGDASLRRIFRDGFFVALLNPKTAIFFAAFLPQFMDPSASAPLQSIALGAVFVVIACITDTVYVMAASMLAPLLSRMSGAASAGRYVTAGAFIGLGIFTATAGGRGK
ncbi:LysE family translocator [Noviherbaspirillum aridicola]|uniref:RhtB family transporter n=1 Tax=Noviherbaspirillum aridicola TaxID=2849687 RepID=A0ABQ4Q4K3_9BURK|nr:LysE family translocator [Noviherbaspirillum aridicola]GIZ52126.1 RhtB family transporter [Noviherbaspirillum aridicola]